MAHLQGTPQFYGATYDNAPVKQAKADRRPVPPYTIVGCILVPSLVFLAVCYIRCLEIHYASSQGSLCICFLLLLVILAGGCTPLLSDGSNARRRLFGFLLVSSVLAWISGLCCGDVDFNAHFKPYLDITSLNTYPMVDPSAYVGQQFMDAGVIEFTHGSHLDLSKSYGFKNGEVFCVAPVVSAAQKNASDMLKTYDFWAVGLNCCSGHTPDFHCGDYSNPKARKGLRLMNDGQRDFFRLAVEAAKATFNLEASHPVFLHWMEFPDEEIRGQMEDGWKSFAHDVFAFVVFQLLFTTVAVLFFL